MKKKVLSVALLTTLSLSSLIVPAATVDAAPGSVSDLNYLIEELDSEKSEVAKKLQAIQNEVSENEAETKELAAEMEATQTLLEELTNEIDKLKEAIEQREVHLEEQARALQIVGESGNVVKFVLEAESLDEVIGRVDVVSTIVSTNKKTIERQEEDKALVEEKEEEALTQQEEQAKLAGKLESKKAALEEREAEQESILAKIASEKAVAEEEHADLVARAKAAEERQNSLAAARTVTASSSESTSSAVTPSSSKSSSNSTPAPSKNGGSIVGIAHGLTGVPYRTAGSTPSGFDCSGFTSYVFSQAGRSIPRSAAAQYGATSRVSRSQAQPGDLVFFSQGGGIDHVGIYLGGGKFIGSQTSTGVAVASLDSGYWVRYVAGFGR